LEECLLDLQRQSKMERAGKALTNWRSTASAAAERAGAAAEVSRLRADLHRMRDERDEGWEAALSRGDVGGERRPFVRVDLAREGAKKKVWTREPLAAMIEKAEYKEV